MLFRCKRCGAEVELGFEELLGMKLPIHGGRKNPDGHLCTYYIVLGDIEARLEKVEKRRMPEEKS